MTISVIITLYNLESYIGPAINSVLQQTVRPDEIIVVDDGSTDNSVNVVKEFRDKVKLLRMGKNSGVLHAFMKGIKASSGDILAFLDGDDIWANDKLEKVLRVFEKNKSVMMVTHLHKWIDDKGDVNEFEDETHKNIQRIIREANNDPELTDKLLKNSILCYKGVWLGSAFCVRRCALPLNSYEKWVMSLPGGNLTHQDQPLAAYMIDANPEMKIHLINEHLFFYRVYATNSSGSSINLASALRTIDRSIATIIRTRDIVRRHPELIEENFFQENKLKELEFYKSLYQKHRLVALRKYLLLLFTFWNNGQKIKETKRFMACQLLGPSKFLELKTKKRFD